MYSLSFANGVMDKLDIITILTTGVIATTWLMAIRWFSEKLGIVRNGTGRIIGSFLIPWEARNSNYDYAIQFAVGIVFTYIYGFVYHFIIPDSLWYFVKSGMAVGLVHGVFISIFTIMMGFLGPGIASGRRSFELIALPLNIGAQAIFGALVGAAFGYAELTRSFWSFIEIVLAAELVLIGIGAGFVQRRNGKMSLKTARQL